MKSIKNVELVKKSNIYFNGNVTSRTFITQEGEEKSLGIMMIGEYNFGTKKAEIMEILAGEVEVRLENETSWNFYEADDTFEIKANSNFDIKVKTICDYCCSYIN